MKFYTMLIMEGVPQKVMVFGEIDTCAVIEASIVLAAKELNFQREVIDVYSNRTQVQLLIRAVEQHAFLENV